MTTIHRISKEFGEDLLLSKFRPSGYAGWKRNTEAAKQRSEELRRKASARP